MGRGDGAGVYYSIDKNAVATIASCSFLSFSTNNGNGGTLYANLKDEGSLTITGADDKETEFSSCSTKKVSLATLVNADRSEGKRRSYLC